MNISAILLGLWFLGFLVLALALSVVFIVWLIKSPPGKRAWGTALMTVATITVPYNLGFTELLSYIDSRDELPALKLPGAEQKRLKKAENCGSYLAKAELTDYISQDSPKWAEKVLPAILPSKTGAEKYAHEYFDKLTDKEKNNPDIAMRRAVFLLSTGTKTEEALKDLSLESEEDFEIVLETIETEPADKIDPKDCEKIITEKLPKGWYQYKALQRLYEKTGQTDKLKDQVDTLKATAKERLAKSIASLSVVAGYCLLGMITLFNAILIFGKKPFASDNNAFADITGRQLYCAALTAYYMQFVMGFFVGCFLPLIKFLSADLQPQFSVVSMTLIGFFGNIISLLCIRFLLTKPMGTSFAEALRRPPLINIVDSMVWAFGTVCLFQFISFVYSTTLYAIFHTVHSSNNPIIEQVHQALNLQAALPIALLYILTAVTTPFVEEVFFRGICYSFFKKRFGVIAAAFISGAIFGAAHVDPNSFIMLTILGAGLALLYERTGRLAPCVFAHFLWNTWFIVAQFLTK